MSESSATIEEQIDMILDALEVAVDEYRAMLFAEAEAEVTYKEEHAKLHVRLVADQPKARLTDVSERVTAVTADRLRRWKIAQASLTYKKSQIAMLHAKIDVLRTKAANQRVLERG